MSTGNTTAAALVLGCALALAAGAPQLDQPGLYYDEVIQAEPALAFLRGEPPPEVPGLRVLPGTDGFPWMTQPYMGALKSQLLVAVFSGAEPTPVSLRATTLGLGIAGLALWTLVAARVFGKTVALATALLLGSDPSFLFIARHDWGSFSLGLLLRGGAVLGLLGAFRSGSPWAAALGGLCLGLGLYNKIDFAVFIVAAAVALGLGARAELRELLARRPRWGLAAGLGLALGFAPLAFALPDVLRSTLAFGGASASQAGEWAVKLGVTQQVLDGSYFHRLMLSGGDFLTLAEVAGAARSPAVLAFAVAWLGLVAASRRPGGLERPRATALLLVATAAIFAALLLLPRAVRIHHTLNAWPLPQLVIALALGELARRGGARTLAAGVLALVLVGANLRVDRAIHTTLAETQGLGRWSQSLTALADAPEAGPMVALDWGFAGPLHFLNPALEIDEPVWVLRRPRPPQQGVALVGTPAHRYLLFEPPYAVFPFGQELLRSIATLPENRVTRTAHRDASGAIVFHEVRFHSAHRLVHRAGGFEVRFE